jgi:ABC-type glycerol-3-phosphate transport system substrate-binding protein
MERFNKFIDRQDKNTLKKGLTKGMSIFLCMAMGVSLVGCGKSKTDSVKTVAANDAYFSVSDLDYYKGDKDEESSMISVVSCKDKVAMLISVNNYSDSKALYSDTATARAADDTVTVSKDATTTDATTADATTADATTTDATTTDATGADAVQQTKYFILFYDKDGKLTAQTDLSSLFDANSNIMNMSASPDGNLLILAQSVDSVTNDVSYLLYTFDSDGKQTGDSKKLDFDENNSPNQMAVDAKGNMYLTGYGDKGAIIKVLDSQGNSLFDITNGTENINGSMFLINGVMYVDGNQVTGDVYKYMFYPIDTASKKLGEPIDMSTLAAMGSSGFYVGTDGLYYSDSVGVYSIDMATKEKTDILQWNDTDIDNSVNGNQKVIVLSSDKIMIMNTTYTSQSTPETKVLLLTRSAKNPNAGKKIITVAGVGISSSSDVLTAVYNFNKTNTKYRVEVKDYMADQVINTQDDYTKVIDKMNMEIISGDAPDIIYGSNQSFSNYEAKGLLVDLYPLMNKDTTFKKDDYIPSIFKLCETDGHLYKLGTSFSIQGFVGAKSVIGDRSGWTIDEFNQMVSSLPDGVAPLANQTQTTLLTSSLYASLDAFVNNTKSEVTFDSPAFYQLLDYAKTYGTKDDNSNKDTYVDENTMLQNGELALASSYINGPSSYGQYVAAVGAPVSVTGYPSADKRGPMCYMNTLLAISSTTGSKDASWDFVKSFLSEDAQKQVAGNYQIPVLTSAFEDQIKSAMNPDVNGNGMVIYDKMGQVTPMTADAAQAYRDLVNGLNTLASYDQEIVNIVLEEVPEYFDGQKTDKEVAAVIQNRVQTLVNERQ